MTANPRVRARLRDASPLSRLRPAVWRRLGLSLGALLIVGGCSTDKAPDLPSVPAVAEVDAVQSDSAVTERVGKAAITPLGDLNMVQEKIPAVLRDARQKGAYALPDPLDCPHVQDEIQRLTVALGADLDDPAGARKSSLLERGGDAAEDYGVGFVRRTVEGVVPFRSWLRKLTGAEKHSKEVSAAIVAGGVRRAYLKGLRQGMGCVPAPVSAAASAPVPAESPSPAQGQVIPLSNP
jgi:hypothetical protein